MSAPQTPPGDGSRAPQTPPGGLPFDIAGLSYAYPGAAEAALDRVDFAVSEGEFVAVVGPNGSGKSTLARILGGLETPSGTERALSCGHDLLSAEGRMLARRDVGVLFQNPENQLVAECVEEDVAFGLENLGWEAPAMLSRVDEMLERFGLVELRLREPHLLSGGQKQRTALAGVLAVPRRALVLDEPTAMLDPAGRLEVLEVVSALRAGGLTVVFVTQEMDEVVGADRVLALEGGRVAYDGSVDGLFADLGLLSRLRLGLPPSAAVALALSSSVEPGAAALPLTLDDLVHRLRERR